MKTDFTLIAKRVMITMTEVAMSQRIDKATEILNEIEARNVAHRDTLESLPLTRVKSRDMLSRKIARCVMERVALIRLLQKDHVTYEMLAEIGEKAFQKSLIAVKQEDETV